MQNRLKFFREKKGWSQCRLSKESHVSRTTINGIENGKIQSFTLETMKKLAATLDTTINEMFFSK